MQRLPMALRKNFRRPSRQRPFRRCRESRPAGSHH
jgi:hypothetical protein